MQIDPVQQRPADPLAILLNRRRPAAALAFGVAKVTARAGIEMTVTLSMIIWKPCKSASLEAMGGI